MPDTKAQEIIRLAEAEEAKAFNHRNLCQQVADYFYPTENQITTKKTPGEDKSLYVRDPTGIFDSQDMTSGLIGTWITAGKKFFEFRNEDERLNNNDDVQGWLSYATTKVHKEKFKTNYMLQLNETVRAFVDFGTGNMFSEFDLKHHCLNYKDWHISLYTIKQDHRGVVDSVILKYNLTARQASDKYGEQAGPDVLKAVADLKTESKLFPFIHVVRPRINRNVMLVDNLNWPYESVHVNVKEQTVAREGGFEELPYTVGRWLKSSHEKYGRGQAMMMLSAIKELQQMHVDFIECGNRWNNPPLEVVRNNVEGQVNMSPNALNEVLERRSIGAVEQNALGNFPITKDMMEFQQGIIDKGFFMDIWRQFGQMKGDRRVTLEIAARLKEALRRLVSPVSRIETEFFTPQTKRDLMLLIRNGVIVQPPPELMKANYYKRIMEVDADAIGIEYTGELSLAIRDYQARAFEQFASFVANMELAFPGVKDNISGDRSIRFMGRSFGVAEECLATEQERDAARQARQEELARQEALQLAQVASEGFSKTSKKAEEGSPAGALVGALGG